MNPEQATTQTFLRYSSDTDFACESEFIKKFEQSPKIKTWFSFYNRQEPRLRKSYEKFVEKMMEESSFKEVEHKRSSVRDVILSDDDEISFERLWLLENEDTDEKILLSYLKDIEDNCRVLLYSNKIDSVAEKKLSQWIVRNKNKFAVPRNQETPTFKIIAQDAGGLKTISREIKKFGPEIETMLDTHYNEDFKEFSEQMIKSINEKTHGIILLHGIPGTGKTNYIRYLINRVKNKDLFYIPPELVNILTQPSFIEFVMENGDAVFIVEDAEAIIESRENGRNSAVNNILNLCDGIIGEVIRSQFICTFNCGFNTIDDALKRPGRMLGEYEFKKLTADKATLLGKELYGDSFEVKDEMTLAEIYNYNEKKFLAGEKVKSTVGLSL